MTRVIYSPGALRDLDSIDRYWRPRDPDLLDRLLEQLEEALAFLSDTPAAGSSYRGRRRWRIGRTPYLLFYRFDDPELRILHIYHEKQNWRAS